MTGPQDCPRAISWGVKFPPVGNVSVLGGCIYLLWHKAVYGCNTYQLEAMYAHSLILKSSPEMYQEIHLLVYSVLKSILPCYDERMRCLYSLKNGITDACSAAHCCPLLTICPRCCPRHAPDDIIIHCGYQRLPLDGAVFQTFDRCSSISLMTVVF